MIQLLYLWGLWEGDVNRFVPLYLARGYYVVASPQKQPVVFLNLNMISLFCFKSLNSECILCSRRVGIIQWLNAVTSSSYDHRPLLDVIMQSHLSVPSYPLSLDAGRYTTWSQNVLHYVYLN